MLELIAEFGAYYVGSAWEYDEASEEYYLHLFVKEQPDLNWENPEVREAVWRTMRFWLDRGCDGFRVSACIDFGVRVVRNVNLNVG